MLLSINEIRDKITPVAQKYDLRAVYLFGSYARNEADENSDIDLLVDRTDSKIKSMFDMGGLYEELQTCLEKSIDVVTTHTLEQESTKERTPYFIENINAERVLIYEQG